MTGTLKQLAFEIELEPGEKMTLPPSLVETVGAGRWIITVRPAGPHESPMRNHNAFLRGYAPEDEGLYDDDQAG